MFESPFSKPQSQSLFSSDYSLDGKMAELYRNMESMRNSNNNQPQRTVFTDIAEELSNVSNDERDFIFNSKEYISVSQKYQEAFSSFLISYLGNDFLKTENSKVVEEVLLTIKKKKEEYKDRFATNINEIREKNENLAKTNDDLMKVNQELQKQLQEIQKKIGVAK